MTNTDKKIHVLGTASRVVTGGDVVQRCAASSAVQERVEEPERGLASSNELVVQERDDGRECRATARGPVDGTSLFRPSLINM